MEGLGALGVPWLGDGSDLRHSISGQQGRMESRDMLSALLTENKEP